MVESLSIEPEVPPGVFLLIKDTFYSNGSFLLHHFLKNLISPIVTAKLSVSTELNSTKGIGCFDVICFLALSQPFSNYAAIARKQGFNLAQLCHSGKLIFIDLLSEPYFQFGSNLHNEAKSTQRTESNQSKQLNSSVEIESKMKTSTSTSSNQINPVHKFIAKPASGSENEPLGSGPLVELFHKIKDLISSRLFSTGADSENPNKRICIMIDDVALLESVSGFSTTHTLEFVHYCRTLRFGSQKGSVVVLAHSDTEAANEKNEKISLIKNLDNFSDAIITVEPLTNGSTENVHGKINIFQKSLSPKKFILPERRKKYFRNKILHYKVAENNVSFFYPGSFQ